LSIYPKKSEYIEGEEVDLWVYFLIAPAKHLTTDPQSVETIEFEYSQGNNDWTSIYVTNSPSVSSAGFPYMEDLYSSHTSWIIPSAGTFNIKGRAWLDTGTEITNKIEKCVQEISVAPTLTTTTTSQSTTTTSLPGECPCYRGKSFYTGDYHYIFYYDCVDIVYKTSVNGVSWSEKKIAVEKNHLTSPPDYFDVYYDENYVYLSYQHMGARLGFKRGEIKENDKDDIVWSQTSLPDQGTFNYASKMSVVVDSNGKPWLTARVYDSGSSTYKQLLYYNSQGDGSGTWNKWNLHAENAVPFLVSLTNGKVYVLYYIEYKSNLIGRIYNSGGMVSQDNVDILDGDTVLDYLSIAGASNDNDRVYVTWLNSNKDIKFRERTTSWQIPKTLATSQLSTSYPDITSNRENTDVHVFWFDPEEKLKMKERINSIWSGLQKPAGDYFNEPRGETLRTFTRVMSLMVGESWCEKKSSKSYVHYFSDTDEVLRFNNETEVEVVVTTTTIPEETTTTIISCTDSDGGKNYYEKGYVEADVILGVGITEDICLDEIELREMFCNENNEGEPYLYKCPDGCEDGVCISATTTTLEETTTIPTEFTVTNFDCNSVSEGCYECLIEYPATSSQKAVMFLMSDADGKVWKSGLENINTGSTESQTTFCCDTLTGAHKISYWVYDDSSMSNLITWSTPGQKKDVECQ